MKPNPKIVKAILIFQALMGVLVFLGYVLAFYTTEQTGLLRFVAQKSPIFALSFLGALLISVWYSKTAYFVKEFNFQWDIKHIVSLIILGVVAVQGLWFAQMTSADHGTPEIFGDEYVLQYRGQIVKSLTENEYDKELRMNRQATTGLITSVYLLFSYSFMFQLPSKEDIQYKPDDEANNA